jgi:alpha-L-rhamnosidase
MIRKVLETVVLIGAVGLSVLNNAGSVRAAGKLTPVELRCEYVRNPVGVDVMHPRLFWKLQSSTRDQHQTAYQILVASSAEGLGKDKGDLWDSGKEASDETIQILYRGLALKSSQQVFWKVRVWDRDGNVSPWSQAASWTMGILNEEDWQSHWIGAGTDSQTLMLRYEFDVKPGLKYAIAHVCGLGHYEMTLNERRVCNYLLSPGWTKYDKTCLYDTHDITPLLRKGRNAVGLLLGNGMYNVKGGRYTKFIGSFGPLKAICQIQLAYTDGSSQTICTDDHWRVKEGPITFSCVYGGEDYDARLEPPGWNQPGFNDAGWQRVRMVEGPGGKLKGLSAAAPPIQVFDALKPSAVKKLQRGVAVYDLGQNASIMPHLKVNGPPGSMVRIIPAELLNQDGSVDRNSCAHGGGLAYWQYTLQGSGTESWFPKFFYHGCRYMQVECIAAKSGGKLPFIKSLEGVVVHSNSEPVGEFACSNNLLNRIHSLVRWAQRSNMMSVMTDCPHREKLGWLEQYHLNGPSLRYEFDLARLFTKSMNDMADSQLDNGLVPDTAPEYVVMDDGFRDSPEWGSAFVLVPWQQYQWTGDLELLRRHYDDMKQYVTYLSSRADNHIVSYGLGDWYDIGPKPPGIAQLTPVALTATAFYYYDTYILAKMAALLDRTEDAEKYEVLAGQIRKAFNQKFFNPETGQYATGSQSANSIPIVMGLVEPNNRAAVLEAIVQDIHKRGNALTAGDVGYRYLLRALAEGGRSDVVFAMDNQSDKPGYGYQLKMGATSLTEAWDADRRCSQNHFMLGQIMEWFYHDVAGIGLDPAGPGFKKIIIRPQPVGNLKWVKASYDSIRGRISSKWKWSNGGFTMKVVIPANTTATVFVPSMPETKVSEGKVAAEDSLGVIFLRREDNRMVYMVGCGEYEFHSLY